MIKAHFRAIAKCAGCKDEQHFAPIFNLAQNPTEDDCQEFMLQFCDETASECCHESFVLHEWELEEIERVRE